MPNLKIIALGLLYLLFCACQNANDQSTGGLSTDTTSVVRMEDTAANAAPEQNKVAADWLLVPGKSAGQTKLQEASESVMQRLGPPDGGDAAMMHAVSVWYADSKTKSGHTLSIFIVRDAGNDPAARIIQVRVNSPRFRTGLDIGTGTPLTEIERQFQVKKVKEIADKGPAYTLYDDSAAGIAFEIDAAGKCQAVIIHEIGKPFAGSYLTFP